MFSLPDGLLFDQLDQPQLIAVIEHGQLVDLWCEDSSPERLGSVHLARVGIGFANHRRMSGQLQSGTIISWPSRGQNNPEQGQLIPVTITAVARQDKPVQAVGAVELAGRYVLLRWHDRTTGAGHVYTTRKAGRHAPPSAQIQDIKQVCEATGVLDAGFDVVLRRSAFGAHPQVKAHIQHEVAGILADWTSQADMPSDLRTQTNPRVIYKGQPLADAVCQLYRDQPVKELTSGDKSALLSVYEKAVQPRHETETGAVLWLEQTRAGVMVDVDSAASKLAPDQLCHAILPEVFTQTRLRRLAGKILVDMPYLYADQRRDVLAKINRLACADPRYPYCFGFTRSGLLELSVRHGRPVLDKDDVLRAVMGQLGGIKEQ